MIRKSLIIFLAIFAIAHTPACTSHSSDGAEASDDPDAKLDVDAASTGGGDAAASPDDAIADLGDDAGKSAGGAANPDALGADEKLPDDTGLNDAAPPAENKDAMATETPPADSSAPPAAEPAPEPVAKNDEPPAAPPPAEPIAPTPDPGANPAAAAPVVGSLKKIPTAPYKQGKALVNAVYIARNGDSVKSISQKIYGSEDHVKDLCKINSYNCSRSVKVGDKFFYNSPKRTTDDQSFKTFYEDAGVPAETYTAKEGDNIRDVGKQLLNSPRGWMELWATNQEVESKGALTEGTQLKYWPDVATPSAPTMAKNEGEKKGDLPEPPPDAAPPAPPAPPDQANANPPPPPPPGDLPPPPPPDQAKNDTPGGPAAGTVQPPAPPPPPPQAPPPPQKTNPAPAADSSALGDDPNQTMVMGVGAILALAAIFLVISIRKKRRNKIDYNTATQTQIDS